MSLPAVAPHKLADPPCELLGHSATGERLAPSHCGFILRGHPPYLPVALTSTFAPRSSRLVTVRTAGLALACDHTVTTPARS